MDLSPEMVACVFHGTFHFDSPQAMEKLLKLEQDQLPPWHELGHAVRLNATGQDLAGIVLKEPAGAGFLTVAAVLEYLYHRSEAPHPAGAGDLAPDGDEGSSRTGRARELDHGHDWDADDHREASEDIDQEEASQDWLEGQGFDRKE